MSVFGCRCAEDPKCPRQLAGRNVFWRSKSATSRRASANAATAAGSSSQPLLDDLRLLGRSHPPAVAEDEVAADPGADEDRELRAGEELQPPPTCRDGRRQREQRRGVDDPVDRGRSPHRVIRGHGQPVDPPDDAGRQRGSRGAGRDDVTQPDPVAWLHPTPRFGHDGERDQDDRPVRQDRVDRMTVDDGMLRKVHRMSSYALLARPPVGA